MKKKRKNEWNWKKRKSQWIIWKKISMNLTNSRMPSINANLPWDENLMKCIFTLSKGLQSVFEKWHCTNAHAIENTHMENCDIFQRITAVMCWWSICTFHNIPLRLNSFRFCSCVCVCVCTCACAFVREHMLYILQMMLVLFVIWNERSFSFGFASYFIGHKSARSQRDTKIYACERVSSRISEALRIPI